MGVLIFGHWFEPTSLLFLILSFVYVLEVCDLSGLGQAGVRMGLVSVGLSG